MPLASVRRGRSALLARLEGCISSFDAQEIFAMSVGRLLINPLMKTLFMACFAVYATVAFQTFSASAVDWLGGTGNWSDPFFWSSGFEPGPGEDLWINAAGGSTINFDVPAATVAELRLGNGEDNQNFNIPSGTLTLTADSAGAEASWTGRWSLNTATRISGTGTIEVTNLAQNGVPYYIAGDQGPGGGSVQNTQFIVEGDGRFLVRDGGAPLDANGLSTAGHLGLTWWREARATVTVKDNGLIDVAGNFQTNSGGLLLNQTGGTINIGGNFFLDRYDAIDGQGLPAESTANLSAGSLNVGWNFHVVQNGKGQFNVSNQGQISIDNILKVNDVFPGATGADGNGTLNITEGGLVTTRFLEVPNSSQLTFDVAELNISGGLLVIEDNAVETVSGPLGNVTNPIADDVAAWISSGFITGSLGTVNRTPSVAIPSISTLGDIAWGRASAADGGALYIWTEAIVADDADFDGNGIVNGRDFLIWQRGFGTDAGAGNVAAHASGNANGDQFINGSDLSSWQAQYGTAPLVAISAVPEPTSLTVMTVLLLNAVAYPWRRRTTKSK
jgi:hypothetical protein